MAVLGIVPHTGWAWFVCVSTNREVVFRERVIAVPVLEAELYHATRDHEGDRARFLMQRRADALAQTITSVRTLCSKAKRAVVLGKQPALPALDTIVRSHAMIHTAEGELWRALFGEACTWHGLAVNRTIAASKLSATDERWLAAAGKALGSPWTAEIKQAALAARAAVEL